MRIIVIMSWAVALALAGCGDEGGVGNCVSLCSEAQAGKCTVIKGDCGAFCGALDTVAGPASCQSQRDAYQSCLNKTKPVCGGSCGATESALSTCVGAYCLTHSTDKACQTLLASFL